MTDAKHVLKTVQYFVYGTESVGVDGMDGLHFRHLLAIADLL